MKLSALGLAILLLFIPTSLLAKDKHHNKAQKSAKQAAPGMRAAQASHEKGARAGKHAGKDKSGKLQGKPGKSAAAGGERPEKPDKTAETAPKPEASDQPKEKEELPVATADEKTQLRKEIRKRVAAQIRPSNDLFKNACDSVANAIAVAEVSKDARKRIVEDLVTIMNGAGKKTQVLASASQDIQAVLTGAGALKERVVTVSGALRAVILDVQLQAGVNVAEDLKPSRGSAGASSKGGKGGKAKADVATKAQKPAKAARANAGKK